ncbi:MAG: Nramp family divalent metal transporter [Candidatus Blackburnbacteria bacterium]|nr:Nramp family divalent metal transporter [Candidatus Blackburnbacteria bacterium]
MFKRIKRLLKIVGPGVITGASDDDPSGIAIYSQTGAQGGTQLLWTAPFLLPFMVTMQEMCARIGMVTGKGLIGAMRNHYPSILLWITATTVLVANTVNIGADLLAMAASTRLLFPIDLRLMAVLYALVIIVFLVFFPYKTLAKILKWLTLSLFAYIFTLFIINPSWTEILKSTFIPTVQFNRESILLVVALMGTTISPYLFFWQASQEAEEEGAKGMIDNRRKVQIVSKGQIRVMEQDVTIGMFFSNLVMFFIIATTGSTLFKAGIFEIQTAEQAASALRPLAGDASFLLFTLGILGTGFLAIPILAGAGAYAMSEIFGFREGFNGNIARSKLFYAVIFLSILAGLLFTLFNIPPFRALFITGVFYGILSPVLIVIILDISNRESIMGNYRNGMLSNILGVTTFVLMTLAAIGAMIL